MNEWNDRIELPQLQSVKLGNAAFQNTNPFVMTNLTSLESIEFGNACFNSGSSFSLTGMID